MADKISDEKLISLVNNEFDRAQGRPGGDISVERARNWRYYLSKPRGDEVEDESQVVTHDVADIVDGIMPSLLRIFTPADNLVTFDPVETEDVEAAKQESDYVSYVFFKRNDAYMILYTWFMDALIQKNGIVKCWWDELEIISYETYTDLTEDEYDSLLAEETVEEVVEDKVRKESVITDLGELETEVHDCKILRVERQKRVKVDNVPPEEFRVSSDVRKLGLNGARFVGHERMVTRSELLEMGFDDDIVKSLRPEQDDQTNEKSERHDKTDDQKEAQDSSDISQDQLLLREAYIRVDRDGDGRSELNQTFSVGNKMLSTEPFDSQPFHVISPHPLPHKFFGQASAENGIDLQDMGTTLTRQMLMNLYHVNNPAHGVWEMGMGDTTMDDLLTTKVGTVRRFARPVNESYTPMTVPFTAGQSFPMLEHIDKLKRDRTGVHADSEGLSPEALKNIQQSVLTSVTDISKMKIEAIARTFAETGLKSLFLHIHELVRKHQQKKDIFALRGQYIPVSPTGWRRRYDMTAQIGLGISTREQNLLHLNAIREMQASMIDRGGMNLTVKPKHVYSVAAEYVKNANLADPGKYFEDPGEQDAPPPSEQQLQLQQQQQALLQRQQQIEERDQQLKAREQDLKHEERMAELERKYQKDLDDSHIANEQLRNDLTELELKYSSNVPGSRV